LQNTNTQKNDVNDSDSEEEREPPKKVATPTVKNIKKVK